MYNAQQHSVTSSTWMVYGPYDTPIGFAEQKVTEYLDDDGTVAAAIVDGYGDDLLVMVERTSEVITRGLLEIVDRGTGVLVERLRVAPPQPERDFIILAKNASRYGHHFTH